MELLPTGWPAASPDANLLWVRRWNVVRSLECGGEVRPGRPVVATLSLAIIGRPGTGCSLRVPENATHAS